MKVRVAAVVCLLVLLGFAGWVLLRDPALAGRPQATSNAPTVTLVQAAVDEAPELGVGIVPAQPNARSSIVASQATASPAQRAALREAILASVAKSNAGRRRNGEAEGDERSDAEGEPAAGNIKDRIGGRDALMKAMNEDFLPLADECILAAQERDPSLTGMLAIGLTVAGDPELGSVVEAVSFGERNELTEAGLLECVENTALSTFFPPPPDGVEQESFELTLPIEPTRYNAPSE